MSVLTTARLILRPFRSDDLAAYAAIRARPEVARWLPPGSEPAEVRARKTIEAFAAAWAERGYGPHAAFDRASGRLLGHLGLRYLPQFEETEVLYALTPEVWGQGLAFEGTAAARDWGFGALGLARLMAITLAENRASRRVMEKLGLRYEKDTVFHDLPVVYYALDRPGA